jgi:hypothetical protein
MEEPLLVFSQWRENGKGKEEVGLAMFCSLIRFPDKVGWGDVGQLN